MRSGAQAGHSRAWFLVASLSVAVGACSDSTSVEADPAVARFVGDWVATALVVTSQANPETVERLIQDLGGTFTIHVEPSGGYTATLKLFGLPATQIGQLSVSGNIVTLTPSFPEGQPVTSGTFEFQGITLIIDGETEFDFNLDGIAEPAFVHFELTPA